jgi:uncharacterized protein YukE
MPTNLDAVKTQLDSLIKHGVDLLQDLLEASKKSKQKKAGYKFGSEYQRWYSESLEVVRQLIPNRLQDFRDLYKRDKRKDITYESYTISDYHLNMVVSRGGDPLFNTHTAAFLKFQQQVLILQSAESRFKSALFDIKQVLRADLFDSELESARELLKNGFLRVAGVMFEKHLAQVCANHNVVVSKKNSTISDYNDLLKNANVIDVIIWRFNQHLGDLRNLCDHNKGREPNKSEVAELIDGTDKTLKTLF